MASYSKTVNFLAKDSLLTGNPAKKVKGAEIDTELNNLATADADNVKTSALGTGVATALGVNVGSAGAPVLLNGAGGTPSSLTGTNITGTAAGLTAGVASAVAVGGLTGLGTGVATALAVNVGSVGAPVVLNGALGTPSSGTLTNATGLPAAGVTGTALVSAAIGTTVQAYDATLASLAGLTLTEGALLTATGADAAAVLAKGTASQQLRMNVGATAPEWFTPSTSSLYIQVVYTDIAAASGNTEIPYDNTTPLSTEGTQAATLAITPADNTNLVEVTAAFNISVTQPGTTQAVSAALFRGTTCLSVQTLVLLDSSTADSMIGSVAFNLIDAPASSSAVTYSIRVGSETAGTGWSIGNLSKFAGAGDENQLILKEIAV